VNYSPLLLQLVIIIGTARLLGQVLKYFGQSAVIGEMAAGFVLGPVVFGAIAPELHAQIFDPNSLAPLKGLSELGLVLFMFIVGAELRLPTNADAGVRRQLVAAGWVAILSVAIPLLLGLGVAIYLYVPLSPPSAVFWPFALFFAVAMSVTAFPVMARILKDRQLTHTTMGRLSLTAAAFADVLAWVMLVLVVVLADSGQDWARFAQTLGGLAVLGLLMFGAVRPLLARLVQRYARDGTPQSVLLAGLLIGTFSCAYITELLHVHAVFGAFLFGACLPRDDKLLAVLIERLEHLAIIVLMPIFFALAGLSTTPDAFVGASLGALLLILGVAVVGKVAGGALGARIGQQPWRVALGVGALMNARGMMELIVIKVGLDIGVIDDRLFTMLMVMAIVTTLMTGPLLSLFVDKPVPQSPQPAAQGAKLEAAPAKQPSEVT
jgi:Kef-type K+ transport system membrane component KefB